MLAVTKEKTADSRPLRGTPCTLVVLAALGLSACGGLPPGRDLSGLWEGRWKSTSQPEAGTLTIDIERVDETSFEGSGWVQGSPLLDHGTLVGEIDWPHLRGEIRGGMSGSARNLSLGNVTVAFSAIAESNRMVGTFRGRLLIADHRGQFEVKRPPPGPREPATASGN